jgi:hypothetical protein
VVVLGEEGAACNFESEERELPVEFAQLGINVTILEPGQHSLYHAASNWGRLPWA